MAIPSRHVAFSFFLLSQGHLIVSKGLWTLELVFNGSGLPGLNVDASHFAFSVSSAR